MRTIIIVSMVFSFSAFSQSRVRENIKQQSIVTETGEVKILKKAVVPSTTAIKKTKR